MKFISLILLLCTISLSAQTGNSQEINSKGKAKYPLISGKIVYEISGDATGTATRYFDRNGWRELLIKEITFKKYGVTSIEKTMTLIDGDRVFNVNLKNKSGTKSKNHKWSKLSSYKDQEEIVQILNEAKYGKTFKDSTLINYKTQIWEFSKGSTRLKWIWNGISLREEQSLGNFKYIMEAISFDENIAFSDEIFALPLDIKWVDPN